MKHYSFIDYATQLYMALVGLLILLFHNETVPQWPWLVAGHGCWLVAAHVLIQAHGSGKHGPLLDFFRGFYPIMLYIPIYNETGHLNQLFATGMRDPFFIRLDQAVFGCQPSLEFMARLPYLAVSELFYLSYFSYYIMITGCGLALFLQNRERFRHYISLVSFVFYGCFITYIFLPVVGPRIFYRELGEFELPPEFMPAVVPAFPEAIQSGPFYQIMALIYRHFETPGAAFPSSHVAVALTTLYFSFKYLRKIRWPHAVMATLLCLSTVYCRYHYAVDIAGGALAAAIMIPLGNWLMAKAGQPPAIARIPSPG
jgi:membrane-associated phospholipid phosphatase